MKWNHKHAFYLGKVMGTLHKDMKFSMDSEEEQVYDRVIRAIETIAEIEVYNMDVKVWTDQPEVEEDGLH